MYAPAVQISWSRVTPWLAAAIRPRPRLVASARMAASSAFSLSHRSPVRSQVPKQARAGLAPERHPDPPLGFGQPAGASCAGSEQLGQALGEGPSGAGRVAAVEPAHPQLDPDRPPERG